MRVSRGRFGGQLANLPVTIEERLGEFRDDLQNLSVRGIVDKHITFAEPFALTAEAHLDLRSSVASHFSIHATEVVVVGSAKLGFSVVREKRYRHFGDSSDIDVALCSGELFDSMWLDVFTYWACGGSWEALGEFRKYLFKGWLRPDKLPPTRHFARAAEWWNFFRELTSSGRYGRYKISGALYKGWPFLEAGLDRGVADCKRHERGEV